MVQIKGALFWSSRVLAVTSILHIDTIYVLAHTQCVITQLVSLNYPIMSHRRKVLCCCCCCECRKKCNDAPWWLFVVNTSSVCMIIIACTLRTYHCNVGFGGPLSTRPLYTPWGGPVGNANTTLCAH